MSVDTETIEGWLAELSAKLGIAAPTESEISELLEVARHAARKSERQAAPIACWLAGKSGVSTTEVLAMVEGDPLLRDPASAE